MPKRLSGPVGRIVVTVGAPVGRYGGLVESGPWIRMCAVPALVAGQQMAELVSV